ncbi:GGDEF domain-containing protein [Sulfurimonas sp.]|uniref:GGDEF domain-containing protein n=1 Tax=Sulfurimonas sp. TaxID=2022749 RepID=UPI0025CC5C69|nr:GGDEF domain-containing protein [Sulfurimonas sp.]MBT5935941.1 GGDEF domain-containing protein [Sulfurimonas sp.]
MISLLFVFIFVFVKFLDDREKDFYNEQVSIAANSTKNISFELENILRDKKQLVKSFFEDNRKMVNHLIENSNDYSEYERLDEKLGKYFTDYFSLNITNDETEFVVDEFEGKMGWICRNDVAIFLKNSNQKIRIHPNAVSYHYDILIDFKYKSKTYVFIVAFKVDEIASLLKISTRENHELVMINKSKDYLIAVTANGSRDILGKREGIHLNKGEIKNILSEQLIKGTFWSIVDVVDENLLTEYKNNLLSEEVFELIVYLLLNLFVGIFIILTFRKKENLQHELLTQNETIEALNDKLHKLAITDLLTSMYNYRYYEENSLKYFNESKRLEVNYHIAVIDIDFFKQYNDHYGHKKGDVCIQSITKIMKDSFRRANEFCARYGGEEFVIVSIGHSGKEFSRRLNKLIQTVEDTKIEHAKSSICDYVTVSAGYSSSEFSTLSYVDEYFEEADTALYRSKSNGRNKVSRID